MRRFTVNIHRTKERIRFLLAAVFVFAVCGLGVPAMLFAQTPLLYERLDGEWEFFVQKTPERVFAGEKPDTTVNVPGFWNKTVKALTGIDNPCTFGTFRYTKTGLDPCTKYALLIKDSPATSCAVYVNGVLSAQNGNPFPAAFMASLLTDAIAAANETGSADALNAENAADGANATNGADVSNKVDATNGGNASNKVGATNGADGAGDFVALDASNRALDVSFPDYAAEGTDASFVTDASIDRADAPNRVHDASYITKAFSLTDADTSARPLLYTQSNSVNKPVYSEFVPDAQGNAEIVIFVANYFYRKGGLWDSVLFGTKEAIQKINTAFLTFYSFTAGILLFIALINGIQFVINRRQKEHLYSGITAFVCSLRVMTATYCLLGVFFPNFPAELKYKLEYAVMWVSPICFIKMLCFLYPVKKKCLFGGRVTELALRRVYFAFALGVGICSIVLPPALSSKTVPFLQGVVVVASLYSVSIIAVNIKRKSSHIGFYFASCMVLMVGAISDIAYSLNRTVIPFSMFPFFLVLFNLVQILLIVTVQHGVYKNTQKITGDLQRLNDAYLRFVPREFLKLLNKESITAVRLGDYSRIKMTVLFAKFPIDGGGETSADVKTKNGTATGDGAELSLENHFAVFNECLRMISPLIAKNGGFVSKFLSGGIMALFPKDATDAVLCALEMIAALTARNREQTDAHVNAFIGLHYGAMIIGTIGEENRLDDTVISDTVNTASRIESVCERLNQNVIVSHSLYEELDFARLRHTSMHKLESMSVKGKQKPLELFAVAPNDVLVSTDVAAPNRAAEAHEAHTQTVPNVPTDTATMHGAATPNTEAL